MVYPSRTVCTIGYFIVIYFCVLSDAGGSAYVLKTANLESIINPWKCIDQVGKFNDGVYNAEPWALAMKDSWATDSNGLSSGVRYSFGHFRQCVETTEGTGTITGKYCLLKYIKPNSTDDTTELQERLVLYNVDEYYMGVCYPSTCAAKTIAKYYNQVMDPGLVWEEIDKTIESSEVLCYSKDELECYDENTLTSLLFFCLLLVLIVVLSTLYDMLIFMAPFEKIKFFTFFSLFTNAKELFNVDETSPLDPTIQCIHGIRALSLIWVILGMTVEYSINRNPLLKDYCYNLDDCIFWHILLNGSTYAVDTFLVIDGFLGMKNLMNHIDELVCYPRYYLQRYVKLTPVIISMIGAIAIFGYQVGYGPFWKLHMFEMCEGCNQNWWNYLFYIQNYSNDQKCMPHLWYFAVDLHLHLLLPIIAIPLWQNGWIRSWPVWILIFGSTTYTFNIMEYQETYTHNRMSPWLIGMLIAYKIKKMIPDKEYWTGLRGQILWVVSIIGFVIICLVPEIRYTLVENYFRLFWSLIISWILFSSAIDPENIINSLLSLNVWQPLSKLSFSMYVWSRPIIITTLALIEHPIHFAELYFFQKFLFDFGIIFVFGMITYMVIEVPFRMVSQLL